MSTRKTTKGVGKPGSELDAEKVDPTAFIADAAAEQQAGVVHRHCAECSTEFTRRQHNQRYCSVGCKKKANNRDMLRGASLFRMAYHWRKAAKEGRDQDAGRYLSLLTRALDDWRKDDIDNGRKPPALPEY